MSLTWFFYGVVWGWFFRKLLAISAFDHEPTWPAWLESLSIKWLFLIIVGAFGVIIGWLDSGVFAPAPVSELVLFFSNPRLVGLIAGCILGGWLWANSTSVRTRISQCFEAFLGQSGGSSWALQAIAGIFGLVALLLVLNPDLLDRVESFRAGEVEAKFASSSSTRESTRASLVSDYSRETKIEQWRRFFEFLNQNASPIATALAAAEVEAPPATAMGEVPLLAAAALRHEMFKGFIQPTADALICFKELEELDRFSRSPALISLTVSWRSFLLSLAERRPGDKEKMQRDLREILMTQREVTKSIIVEISKRTSDFNSDTPTCTIAIDELSDLDNANPAASAFGFVQRYMSARGPKSSMNGVDPYVVGAMADLLALTSGQTAKAGFLMRIIDRYDAAGMKDHPG